jgi:hypothetical protein
VRVEGKMKGEGEVKEVMLLRLRRRVVRKGGREIKERSEMLFLVRSRLVRVLNLEKSSK